MLQRVVGNWRFPLLGQCEYGMMGLSMRTSVLTAWSTAPSAPPLPAQEIKAPAARMTWLSRADSDDVLKGTSCADDFLKQGGL